MKRRTPPAVRMRLAWCSTRRAFRARTGSAAFRAAKRAVADMLPAYWTLAQRLPDAKAALMDGSGIAEEEFDVGGDAPQGRRGARDRAGRPLRHGVRDCRQRRRLPRAGGDAGRGRRHRTGADVLRARRPRGRHGLYRHQAFRRDESSDVVTASAASPPRRRASSARAPRRRTSRRRPACRRPARSRSRGISRSPRAWSGWLALRC